MNFGANQAGGSTPLAAGFPIVQGMVDMLLRANADRRASIDQQINLARLFADLQRVSPTRAADMAVRLGITQSPDDFGFVNLFGKGGSFPSAGGPGISGTIGNQQVSLPSVFSGQELSFLGDNPNVQRVIADVADKFGMPDIFDRSMAARIPTLSSILGGGFG